MPECCELALSLSLIAASFSIEAKLRLTIVIQP
jgi:hypothetical protein